MNSHFNIKTFSLLTLILCCTQSSLANEINTDPCGMTPLMHAYARCDIETSKHLLEKGANPYETDVAPYLARACSSYPRESIPHTPYPSDCMKDLLDKYKAKKKTYRFLNEQEDEKNLAWLVDRDILINGLRWYEWWLILFSKYVPPYIQAKAASLFTDYKVDYEYIPQIVGYSPLFKHAGINFYNGSIFSYEWSSTVDEEIKGASTEDYYDLILNEETNNHLISEQKHAETITPKNKIKERIENDPKYVDYIKKESKMRANRINAYKNSKRGTYEFAFDAKLMEKAIEITREAWDISKEHWDGLYFDKITHNCQIYIYDAVIRAYLGLGGLMFLKDVSSK